MALILPDYDSYRPDEVLRVPGSDREVRIFRGVGTQKSASEHVVNPMHG